jgi:phage tail-like protein
MSKLIREALASSFGSGLKFANTERHDPYKSFRFEVEISGNMVFAKAGFQKVSGLKMNTDVVEYREGGDNLTVSKSPGLTKFDPITLERGMSEDTDMWDWASKIFHIDETSHSQVKYRANVKIKLKGRNGAVVKAWEIPNAWISKYETGEFDAMGNNVMLETIELQHEGFKKVQG